MLVSSLKDDERPSLLHCEEFNLDTEPQLGFPQLDEKHDSHVSESVGKVRDPLTCVRLLSSQRMSLFH